MLILILGKIYSNEFPPYRKDIINDINKLKGASMYRIQVLNIFMES